MPDTNLNAARQHLSLVRKLLHVRLAAVENQPVGTLIRKNQIAHTRAMLGLLAVLRGMAAHDPLQWWDENDDIPF